jgi:hypothetical protein
MHKCLAQKLLFVLIRVHSWFSSLRPLSRPLYPAVNNRNKVSATVRAPAARSLICTYSPAV